MIMLVTGVASTSKKKNLSSKNSTDSTISTCEIQSVVDRLRCQAHRPSTMKNYLCIWRTFNEFFIKLDVKPSEWEDRIVLFVGYLIQNKFKSTSVRSYISAIKAVLLQDGVILNEDKFLLNALTKACRYQNDAVRTRLPIRRPLLDLLISRLSQVFDQQPYLLTLYQALFTTAYYGLFRIGELTKSEHVVKARDVHVALNKMKMMFILRTSKTHWSDTKPQIVKISSEPVYNTKELIITNRAQLDKSQVCPFTLLQRYVRTRRKAKNYKEQFFVFKDNSPVQPHNV